MTSTTIHKKPAIADYHESKGRISKPFLIVKRQIVSPAQLHEAEGNQHIVHDLGEAKSCLEKTQLSYLPDLIILDIPLNLDELIFFKGWMSKKLIPPIPVIYTESYLNPFEIKNLFQLNLIDDVIKGDLNTALLHEKIRFFRSLSFQSLIGAKPVKIAKNDINPFYREFIKRAIDIFMSLSILIVILPLLLFIGILIKLTSKGPVIYKSKRAGEGFKVFNFYKFRTMVAGAEELLDSLHTKNMYTASPGSPSFFKVSNDPRITRLGLFLRNTSLDELPQLFNVLKGDMSLVGNRPLPLYEAATLTTCECAERFMAPAGITGLWQITKRGKPEMSSEERVSLDIAYARNRSTRRDLRILLTTPSALIQKQSQ